VAQAALDDATAFTGRFDDIARDERENLTGLIVKRLKETFRAHHKSTGLTSVETEAAASCARFLNCNTWADMSGSFRIPDGDTTDDSSDSDSEPTTVPSHAGDPRFSRTAGQGLHVPHPCLSKFTRRQEGLLQRTLLHPRAAAAYRGDLFHHIAEQLRDSKTVRDLWRDVECTVNTGLGTTCSLWIHSPCTCSERPCIRMRLAVLFGHLPAVQAEDVVHWSGDGTRVLERPPPEGGPSSGPLQVQAWPHHRSQSRASGVGHRGAGCCVQQAQQEDSCQCP
jgi:hypothetical protein